MTARAGGSYFLHKYVKEYSKFIKTKLGPKIGPVQVWIVNGEVVRNHIFIDFTEGGNPEAYIWMPPDEIWLDTDVNPNEQKYVLLHELTEMNQMRWDGLGYEEAHVKANGQESQARKDPSKYNELLKKQKDIMITNSLKEGDA